MTMRSDDGVLMNDSEQEFREAAFPESSTCRSFIDDCICVKRSEQKRHAPHTILNAFIDR